MMIKGIAVFTIVEVITLVAWLLLATRMAVSPIVAVGTLFVGLFVEHVVQGVVKAGQPLTIGNLLAYAREKFAGIVAFTGVETVIWAVVLVIQAAAPGPLYASFSALTFAFLALTLVVKHALADNVFAGRRLLDFSRLFEGRNLVASAIEAVGGAIWLQDPKLGTVVVMAGTSFVEHYLLTVPPKKSR